MTSIPLSKLVPSWKGHCSPEAYSAIEKGLCHEQARFLFDRYIVFSFQRDLGYDGCWDRFYFDAGLRRSEDVVGTCSRVLQHRVLETLIRVGPKTEGWQKMNFVHIDPEIINPSIKVLASEKRGDGTGFNSISVYVGVLEVTLGDSLTVADLATIGHEDEVVCYLRHEGLGTQI